jgi:hypothetical protein
MKKAWTIDGVIAALERGQAGDAKLAESVRALGAPLVKALVALGSPRAITLLVHLGGAEATRAAVEALRGPARRAILATLSTYGSQLDLDGAILLPALSALLDDDDRWDAGLALEAIGHLPGASATDVLASRVGAGPMRVEAAFWLALRGEDRGALDATEAALFAKRARDDARRRATRVLELLAEKGDAAARTRAHGLAERFVRANLDATATGPANQVLDALRALDGAKTEAAVIELAATAARSKLVRGSAFARLAQLGRMTVDMTCAALADDDLRGAAARALAGGRVDAPRVLEAVAAALAVEEDEDVCGALVGVLVAHPDALAGILPRVAHKLGGWTRMQLRWVAEGIGPRRAAEQLAGVIDPPPPRRLKSLETKWQREHDPHVVLELLGKRRVTWFDRETGDVVSDHAALCEQLAPLAGVKDLEAEQTGTARDKRYTVRVAAAACEQRFTVDNRGDWYDLDAVLRGLDALLEALGRPERYFALETGDQSAIVVCAPGAKFRDASGALGIPIAPEPAGAR